MNRKIKRVEEPKKVQKRKDFLGQFGSHSLLDLETNNPLKFFILMNEFIFYSFLNQNCDKLTHANFILNLHSQNFVNNILNRTFQYCSELVDKFWKQYENKEFNNVLKHKKLK